MAITLSNNKFLNRIPFENPWISSLIASLIGSAVLVVTGFIFFLFGGGVPDASFITSLQMGSIGFVAMFVICFVACILEFS
jgi:hypothetical protein